MIDPRKNNVYLVDDSFEQPNGLALSVDEKTIYIADSALYLVMALDVRTDGTLTNSRIFAKVYGTKLFIDGVKVDSKDNVYVAGPGGIWVWDKRGKELGIILTPEGAANMNWGDSDRKSFYITASKSLYRTRLLIPGQLSK
jgi:gluconolactonase